MDVQKIMEQVQVFASTYSLVGGRFDDGTRMEQSNEEKAEIEALLCEAADKLNVPPLMIEALRFYADEANWIDSPSWDGDPSCFTPKSVPVGTEDGSPCDCGETARLALKAAGIPIKGSLT